MHPYFQLHVERWRVWTRLLAAERQCRRSHSVHAERLCSVRLYGPRTTCTPSLNTQTLSLNPPGPCNGNPRPPLFSPLTVFTLWELLRPMVLPFSSWLWNHGKLGVFLVNVLSMQDFHSCRVFVFFVCYVFGSLPGYICMRVMHIRPSSSVLSPLTSVSRCDLCTSSV